MASEETFRPEKRKITKEDIERELDVDESDALAGPAAFRKQVAEEVGHTSNNPGMGVQIGGNPPPSIMKKMQQMGMPGAQTQQPQMQPQRNFSQGPNSEAADLIAGLDQAIYGAIQLPSLGRFYDGNDGPTDGILHVREMTGAEEQILATPRLVRKGQAINMIFQRCIREQQFRVENLLTQDRTYLLIWLRGISYSPEYDVDIKCPECELKFNTVIDLNSLQVDKCPDDFHPPLVDTMPKSGLKFEYRLSRGRDEVAIQEYRDRRIKDFGGDTSDDTLVYRTAMLLESIENTKSRVTDKGQLKLVLQNLGLQDVSYIRGLINEPPFGVRTNVTLDCSRCLREFDVELPLEASFFFPRKKKKDTNLA